MGTGTEGGNPILSLRQKDCRPFPSGMPVTIFMDMVHSWFAWIVARHASKSRKAPCSERNLRGQCRDPLERCGLCLLWVLKGWSDRLARF